MTEPVPQASRTIKVLHLSTHLNMGGITKYIFGLARAMRAEGVSVESLSSGGDCESLFAGQGIKTHQLDIRTKSELHPKLYRAIPALGRLVRDNGFDLIHAHTRITQVLAHWVGRRTGVPVVTTCHGFFRVRLGRCVLPAWGDRVIAISEAVRDQLIEDFKVPPGRVRLVFNAVDIEELDKACALCDPAGAKRAFGFAQDDYVIGLVARLVEDKGHAYLIRAVKLLERKIKKIRLLIVGDGKYRGELQKLIAELGMGDRVFFTGNLADVTQAVTAMDIFAFPATWREGFGLSIVEAMAVRRPVIVTDIRAINALIENGVTGLKVEPKDARALAGAIEIFYENPRLRAKVIREARSLVERYFTIPRMAGEMARVYREVLSRKS